MSNSVPNGLKRSIGAGLLLFYGVGVMVGAGIYVLVGEVAGAAGIYAPISFLLAGLIAAPTALSYAELSTRYPEAAGEIAYVSAGFSIPALGNLAGLAIVLAGTVSAAAVLKGGIGYLGTLMPVSQPLLIAIVGVLLVGIAVIGVVESLAFAAILTAIEVVGLALVIGAGATAEPVESVGTFNLAGVGVGATLAFFAFIGFEDIVNLAEETKRPDRVLPIAILGSLAIASLLYVTVSWAAVRSVGAQALQGSERPLALVWESAGGSGALLAAIAVAAALNGVLAQMVMAARVLLGLGRRVPTLSAFAKPHPRFGTPATATILIGAIVISGAFLLPVAELATLTSIILLSLFVLVNLALIRIKQGSEPAAFSIPDWVPWIGAGLSAAALLISLLGLA